MIHTILTKRPSSNKKTGPVFATYRTWGITCYNACGIKEFCYGSAGPSFIAAANAKGKTLNLEERYSALAPGTQVRHNVVGEYFLNGEPDKQAVEETLHAHRKYPDISGWGYIHGWREFLAEQLNALPNLQFLASCETREEVELARSLGWPTAQVVPMGYVKRKGDVFCAHERTGVQCINCPLCKRDCGLNILLTAHGYRKNKLSDYLLTL